VHAVIETAAFLASAADEGIPDAERMAMISYLAANPDAGDLMPGTGGARKVRFATAARVRDWEQGRSKPDGAIRAYLIVIDREREAVERALTAA
jgi:hypothetical protein